MASTQVVDATGRIAPEQVPDCATDHLDGNVVPRGQQCVGEKANPAGPRRLAQQLEQDGRHGILIDRADGLKFLIRDRDAKFTATFLGIFADQADAR